METINNKKTVETIIEKEDINFLKHILKLFGPLVDLPAIGKFKAMKPNDVWLQLVSQVCVIGSAKLMERINADTMLKDSFEKAISLSSVQNQKNKKGYIGSILKKHSATRFHNEGARKLYDIFKTSTVFSNGKLKLFEGVTSNKICNDIRDILIDRCPIFRLKSVSDFMISVGISHDVIALDTRVVGVFKKYLNYNLSPGRVQSNRSIYFSVENALRDFCTSHNFSLALLDRVLFQFSSMTVFELLNKNTGVFK